MSLPLTSPPENLCVLRFSALGDISHALPVVRTIQTHWPQTKLTWIIGKLEYQLVHDIPGIEFIIFDKGKRGYNKLRQQMRGRNFDVLLHMQMSIRASFASLLIPARIRLGFDKVRAKDMQWLFTNHRISAKTRQHVIDSFFCFSEALGIEKHELRWDIPIPNEALSFARLLLPRNQKVLVISPCASMSYRNWMPEGYAAVSDYASRKLGMHVVLCGGTSEVERKYGKEISALTTTPPRNLIGETSIKQLLAILKMANVVIAPDSGPAHLANAVGTPVIGLYAATNPDRARPYLFPNLVINKYPEAVIEKYGKAIDNLPWGIRVRDQDTMSRITAEEVCERLDHLVRSNEMSTS